MLIKIQKEIKAVCPTLVGIQAIDLNDRSSWVLEFTPETPEEQKTLARNTMLASVIPTELDERIKAFAGELLTEHLKDEKTQLNIVFMGMALTRRETKGRPPPAQEAKMDLIEAIQTWKEDVLAFAKAQRAAKNEAFETENWPQPPAGTKQLVDSL